MYWHSNDKNYNIILPAIEALWTIAFLKLINNHPTAWNKKWRARLASLSEDSIHPDLWRKYGAVYAKKILRVAKSSALTVSRRPIVQIKIFSQ